MPLPLPCTPRGPRAATRQRWTELVAEYERGTLTQRAFCEQHSLALSSFARWRRRVLGERADAPPAFVRVSLAEERAVDRAESLSAHALRVTLPSGVRIDGVSATNVALLAELVRTL